MANRKITIEVDVEFTREGMDLMKSIDQSNKEKVFHYYLISIAVTLFVLKVFIDEFN